MTPPRKSAPAAACIARKTTSRRRPSKGLVIRTSGLSVRRAKRFR